MESYFKPPLTKEELQTVWDDIRLNHADYFDRTLIYLRELEERRSIEIAAICEDENIVLFKNCLCCAIVVLGYRVEFSGDYLLFWRF